MRTPKQIRLITIAFSHYNEKARWGLQHFGVLYEEQAYLPGLHALPVAWVTRNGSDAAADRHSSRYSTPVLITDNGQSICDSGRILRWLDQRYGDQQSTLFPNPLAGELEMSFQESLGPATRQVAYAGMIHQPELIRNMAENNVGWLQARLYRMAWPAIREHMSKTFRLEDKASLENSRNKIWRIVEDASYRLKASPYLAGQKFSAADLAFACMLAPVLGVSRTDGFGAWLPTASLLPAELRDFVNEIRNTPAGIFARDLFRKRVKTLR